jgi:phosphate acetyltransferase
VVDPDTDGLRERFAQEYAARRARKGVTIDAARDVVVDVSYFGTLMVVLGLADGMVSVPRIRRQRRSARPAEG